MEGFLLYTPPPPRNSSLVSYFASKFFLSLGFRLIEDWLPVIFVPFLNFEIPVLVSYFAFKFFLPLGFRLIEDWLPVIVPFLNFEIPVLVSYFA